MTRMPARSSTSATAATRANVPAAGPPATRSGETASASRSASVGASARRSRRGSCSALALVPMVVLVVVAAFVGPATDPNDFELPSYADYYEWAMRAARALRSRRGAAPDLPRPPRRRARALRRAADHADRLRRRAVGRLSHRRARRPPGFRRPSSSAGTRSTRGAPGRSSPTTGTSSRASCGGRARRRRCSRPSRCSWPPSRRGARTRRWRCSPCSSSARRVGGIAEDDFSGGVADAVSLVEPSPGARRRGRTGSSGTRDDRPVPGGVSFALAGRADHRPRRVARAPREAAGRGMTGAATPTDRRRRRLEVVRGRRRGERRLAGDRARRHGAARAERRRQDDAAPGDRRA